MLAMLTRSGSGLRCGFRQSSFSAKVAQSSGENLGTHRDRIRRPPSQLRCRRLRIREMRRATSLSRRCRWGGQRCH